MSPGSPSAFAKGIDFKLALAKAVVTSGLWESFLNDGCVLPSDDLGTVGRELLKEVRLVGCKVRIRNDDEDRFS